MNIPYFVQVVGMFIIPLAAVLIPVFIGQRYGFYYSRNHADVKHVPIESVVAAAFGLLAFMLGFTFQIAASRFETRKQLLIEEVKDIRTAYLRAGLIPEPYRSNTKKHLVEYVDMRIELLDDISKVDHAIVRSQVILDSLWKYTEALAEQDRSSEVYALYTTAVNDLFDAFNERITMVFVYRVPKAVTWVLFIMVVLSMLALGYQFGITGKGSSWIVVLLALIFAVEMFLISALDKPETGLVKLNQKPLLTLREQLQKNQ